MLEPYDWVFYTGSDEALSNRILVVERITQIDGSDMVVTHVNPSNVLDVVTIAPSLLEKVKSNAPRFAVGDSVWANIADVDLIESSIVGVFPGLWRPPLYEVSVAGENPITMKDSELVPFYPKMDSTITTLNHISLVSTTLTKIAIELIRRGEVHDQSKLSGIEKECLDVIEYLNKHAEPAPYGTPEYKKRSAILRPMLNHHYAINDHHTEHHENGIYGMTLFSVVEMFADWYAASVRGKDDAVGLTYSAERFCMSDQLKKIFENTYNEMGIKWK